MSFARKFGDKCGKKLMDTATKTGIDASKTASKRVVQKTAEATGDLIGNKISDKITSTGKPKEKSKEIEEIYIPPEKRQHITDDLRLFSMHQRIKMEFQKIVNNNSDENLPRFITKKWVEAYDQSEKSYSPNKKNRIKTSMLRFDLCDDSDAYIVVKGDITLEGDNAANKRNKNLAFKNNALFIKYISKINGIKIDNAEDLDVVMPMYHLLEYSKNYRKTTGSFWNYYRDET